MSRLFHRMSARQSRWPSWLAAAFLTASLAASLAGSVPAASVGLSAQSAAHSTHLIVIRPMGGCPGLPVGC
jgi:hypothetical protein